MDEKNQTSEKLFYHYKSKVESSARLYNHVVNVFSQQGFPKLAGKLWREGMLAEIWGLIATRLSCNKVKYLENWRKGER